MRTKLDSTWQTSTYSINVNNVRYLSPEKTRSQAT